MKNSGLVLCCILFAVVILRTQELGITITEPQSGSRFEECTDIQIAAEAQQLDSIPIKNVKFTRNKLVLKSDTKAPYEHLWRDVLPGFYQLQAVVTDDSANVAYSEPVWMYVGEDTLPNLISNGHFDCGRKTPWEQPSYEGAYAVFNLYEENSWFSDGGFVEISVINAGSADWHVQLQQSVALDSGHTYFISFKADASEPRTFSFMLQYNQDPYDIYFQQSVDLEEAGSFGPYQFNCNVTDHLAMLRFNVGLVLSEVYFDDIVIVDSTLITATPETNINFEPLDANGYIISGNYPNPFNARTTLHYQLPQAGMVSLTIYTITGQKVRTLINGYQSAGDHRLIWDGKNESAQDAPSGIYIYKIEARTPQRFHSIARKIILIK